MQDCYKILEVDYDATEDRCYSVQLQTPSTCLYSRLLSPFVVSSGCDFLFFFSFLLLRCNKWKVLKP